MTMYRGPRISNLDMKTRDDGCPFFYGLSGFLELSRAIASRLASSRTLSRIFCGLRILADLRWKTMVASSKWSLSIWRTRSRTISLNPYQSRFFHVLMLQPGVTVLVSRSALGVCDKTRRRSMTRLCPPKTRSGQKLGSNMHKTITFS